MSEIEEAAKKINSAPSNNGMYDWMCEQCGKVWKEPAEWTDFVNAAGELRDRSTIPNWCIVCEDCTDMPHTYSTETLFHFNCGICKKWWSVADFDASKKPLRITCPHCSHKSRISKNESELHSTRSSG